MMMNQEQLLSVLYDTTAVMCGEMDPYRLAQKTLQKLLAHTGCSVGLFMRMNEQGGNLYLVNECAVGQLVDAQALGRVTPASLLAGKEDVLLRRLFNIHSRDGAVLRFPVPELGMFVLLAERAMKSALQLESMFRPAMGHFANAYRAACRYMDAQHLLQRDHDQVLSELHRFRRALDTSPDMIYLLDADTLTFLDFNHSALTYLGYTRDELLGQKLVDMTGGYSEQQLADYIASSLGEGDAGQIKISLSRKNGSEFVSDIALSQMVEENDHAVLIAVVRDISEQVQLDLESRAQRTQLEVLVHERTSELEKMRDEAIAASKVKSEFMANMSHELRTPMNSILGFTGILKDGLAGDINQEQKKQLEMVYSSANHLLGLINEILDLSKIEAGKIEITKGNFVLEELLTEIIDLLAPQAQEKGLELTLTGDIDHRTVYSDRVRLRQIVLNLINNAVKFTDEGGINVDVTISGKDISIEVSDTGIGIRQDDLDRVFEAFHQVDHDGDRLYDGTGLGLTITREMLDLLGGEISVSSQFGKGSTFHVTLYNAILYPAERSGVIELSRKGSASAVGQSVLVIDDDPRALELLRNYLQKEGFNPVLSVDGRDAVQLAIEHQPFAITLDVIMPTQDGWTTLGQLKKDERTQDIPVVIISILDEQKLGMSLGALDYLTKPIDPSMLSRKLHALKRANVDILVVEDGDRDAELIKIMLDAMDYKTRRAIDGRDGLEQIAHSIPDLVILDLMMPAMNGFEFIRRIRDNPATQYLPVIVVSAKELTESESNFLRDNVVAVMQKGQFTHASMLEEVGGVLQNMRSSQKQEVAQNE